MELISLDSLHIFLYIYNFEINIFKKETKTEEGAPHINRNVSISKIKSGNRGGERKVISTILRG